MKSLRRQLTLTLLAGFGLLLAAGSAALFLGTRAMLLREFDAALLTKARALASLTEADRAGAVELHFEDGLMPEFGRRQHEAFFELRLADGRVLERSDSLGGADLPRALEAVETPRFWNLALPGGTSGRAVSFTFPPPRDEELPALRPAPPVAVVVALSRAHLDAHLRVFALGAAAASLLMIAGAAGVASLAVRRALSPLEALGREVAKIDDASLHARFAWEHLPAELAPICRRLNDLLARLDTAFIRERRFSDDVAHELRTPVAELRALAEFSLAATSPEEPTARGFSDALAIAEQMEEIVNGLLAIARYEGGAQPLGREPIALDAALPEFWRPCAARAAEHALVTDFQISPGLITTSDRAVLRAILANLFSNAAAHAPTGARIGIAARRDAAVVRITISNPVGALIANDLPHLFERFWRKDPTRTFSGHAGLGLSIARAAARRLGADLHAEITPDGLFVIHLTLPAAPLPTT